MKINFYAIFWLLIVIIAILNLIQKFQFIPNYDFKVPFLIPSTIATCICIIGFIAYQYFIQFWETAEPNEWLVIVQNGKHVKSGVGMRTFRWFFQTKLKYPSKINKVSFSAMQVTKEMQGVEICGFAIYQVNRNDDNPLKYYKFMSDYYSSSNIQFICESIIRHNISNSNLEEVIKDRSLVKDKVKEELQKQVAGWGVWVETVEINDVKICSKRLFEDLQAEYKCQENQKAAIGQLRTQNTLKIQKKQQDMQVYKNRIESESNAFVHASKQKMNRRLQEQEFFKKETQNKLETLLRQSKMNLENLQNQQAYDKRRKQIELKLKEDQFDFELKQQEAKLELENNMTELNFQKYQIDSTFKVIEKMPLGKISINSFVPPSQSGVSSLLPGISKLISDINKEKEE